MHTAESRMTSQGVTNTAMQTELENGTQQNSPKQLLHLHRALSMSLQRQDRAEHPADPDVHRHRVRVSADDAGESCDRVGAVIVVLDL